MRATLVEKDLGQPAQSEAERLDPSEFGLLYETHRLSVYRYTAAGTWEVEFEEITYRTSDGEQVLPGGPWTLTVTVP